MNKKISCFDLAPILNFYDQNRFTLLPYLPKTVDGETSCEIIFPSDFQMSKEEVIGLINLFPIQSQNRSITRSIKGLPSLFFDKTSQPEHPSPTLDPEEALSLTAIIPSYYDLSQWNGKNLTGEIHLYRIPDNIYSKEAAKIILSQRFIHEYARGIIAPALLLDDYLLILPNGEKKLGQALILEEFKSLVSEFSPISYHSSLFRGNDSNLAEDEYLKVAVCEELAECITAYLLGFVFCQESGRQLNPFFDRPGIKAFLEDFLNAKQDSD